MAYSAREIDHTAMKIAESELNVNICLKRLGAAIRESRKEQGMSQEALANAVQIDRSHMGRIERGERNVTFANILRIAIGLKCAPSQLLAKAGL